MAENGFAAQLAQDLDEGDLRTVLEVFCKDVTALTDILDANLAAGDILAFRRTCHAMAGAAGVVGAAALEQACRLGMVRADLGPAKLPALHGEIRACSAAALDETLALLPSCRRGEPRRLVSPACPAIAGTDRQKRGTRNGP